MRYIFEKSDYYLIKGIEICTDTVSFGIGGIYSRVTVIIRLGATNSNFKETLESSIIALAPEYKLNQMVNWKPLAFDGRTADVEKFVKKLAKIPTG